MGKNILFALSFVGFSYLLYLFTLLCGWAVDRLDDHLSGGTISNAGRGAGFALEWVLKILTVLCFCFIGPLVIMWVQSAFSRRAGQR